MAFREDIAPKNNSERHVPCVVLVDTSGSMEGNSIAELNEGLRALKSEIMSDDQARLAVEICVISFNSDVEIIQPFVPVDEFVPHKLSANGLTAMNQAILAGLEEIQHRKDIYNSQGIAYYRPWMFLLTDGAPTDDSMESQAKVELQRAADNGKVCFFAVGVTDADLDALSQYKCHNGAALSVKNGVHFKELFQWLSSSMKVVASSKPDSNIVLPPLPDGVITIGN